MGKRKLNYLFIVVSCVQALILLLPFVFEYLAKKKPLVMRHLYTKKLEHLSTYLDISYRNIYSVIILIAVILLTILLLKKSKLKIKDFMISICVSVFLIAMISFDFLSKSITYSYTIAILLIVLILEFVKMYSKIRFSNRNNIFI